MKFWKKWATLSKRSLTVHSTPVYKEKYPKTKVKSYNGIINTNFENSKILKEGFQCICLSVILIDSVYRKDKDYFPQGFLE